MAQLLVKVVEDNTLAADEGWAMARAEDTGDHYFIVEKSAAADEAVLSQAWYAARQLVIEQAVRDGIVEFRDPTED